MSYLGKRKYGGYTGSRPRPSKMARYRLQPIPQYVRAPVRRRPQVATLNARTAGYLGIETKFVDYERNGNAVLQTVTGSEYDPATQLQLSGVAVGDGESQRDGRVITLKSLHIRGHFNDASTDDNIYRILIVKDTQTNGAQFNAEDVLLPPTAGALAVDAFRNLQYVKRFQVLKDMTIRSVMNYSDETPIRVVPFKINLSLNNCQVNHSDSGATVASVTDNSIHMIVISRFDNVSCDYVVRTRYVG